MQSRRKLLSLYLAGGAVALLASGCTPQQVSDTEQKIADIINQVQKGVAQACAAVGKLIPTANTVFAVLASIVGSSNVAVATAVMIAQAITDIAAAGCPTPTASPRASTTAKGVKVEFY